MARWTKEFREIELRKHKIEVLGAQTQEQSHNAVRYAIVMNTVGEVCSDISHDSGYCQELLDAVKNVHNKYLAGREGTEGNQEVDENESKKNSDMALKDPAVKKNKSVNEGNRMKPRSEIEAQKCAARKRKKFNMNV